jgi:VWFA-related protein
LWFRLVVGASLLALLSVFLSPAALQQDAARPKKPLQHEVSVTLKLIQVIVTDKVGNPVTDLRREDFVLTDNGREMRLTEFEKHLITLPVAAEPAERKAPPAVATAPAAVPAAPPRLNRKFFFFFDFAYNNPAGVRKMAEAALRFLDTQVLPTDEVGLLSYTPLKLLQIHLHLTTDHQKIRAMVAKVSLRDSSERFEDLEDKYQRELEAGGLADARPEGKLTKPAPDLPELNLKDMWALSAKTYIESLAALAYALQSIEGQKNLVLFSEGIPYPVAYGGRPELRKMYESLLKDLQTANVSVYSMYTGGITLADTQTGAWTLSKTSYETGGQYWGNMFNYEPFIEKLQTMTGSYYVLGYPVSDAWDGKYHRVQVTVRRPGVEVRSQWGYSNPKPFAEYTDLEKRIQLVDLALAEKPISQTPALFEMAVVPFSADPAGNVAFVARVGRDKLDAVMGKKVEVVGLVFDAADEIVELWRNEEDLTRVGPAGVALLSVVGVAPGAYRFRVVIRNLETGAAARAGVTAVVPEAKPSGIALLPPVLWKADRGASYLKAFTPKAAKKAPRPPLAAVLGADPRLYVPCLERTLACPSEVWASIRCLFAEIAAPRLELSASLEDIEFGGFVAVPLEVLFEKDEAGGKEYFLRLEIPEVEPGSYRLTLRVDERTSGASSAIANDFEIERREPDQPGPEVKR